MRKRSRDVEISDASNAAMNELVRITPLSPTPLEEVAIALAMSILRNGYCAAIERHLKKHQKGGRS